MAGCVNNTEADGLVRHGKTVYDADGSGGCSKHPPGPDHSNLRERLPMAPRRIGLCNHCRKPVGKDDYYCSLECVFWSKVDIRGPDECWPWLGAKLKQSGYGIMAIPGSKPKRITTANRVSLAIKLGRSLDDDIHACHRCDNTGCVNPAHVFEGTAKENNEDKVRKGRQSKGDQHGRSKLAETQVRAILTDTRTHAAIAADYGVARNLVTRIKNGTRWRHLQMAC